MQSTKPRDAFLALILIGLSQAAAAVDIVHKEPLGEYVATHAVRRGPSTADGDIAAIGFNAHGRRFDITLAPNRKLIDAARRNRLGSGLGIYSGKVAGVAGSWARLVFENGQPQGLIGIDGEIFAIEVLTDESLPPQPYIFRLDDLLVEPGMLACSSMADTTTAAGLAEGLIAETAVLAEPAAGATLKIDLAVIGDFEFSTAKGNNAETAMITRINNVDGIFSSQLGVELNISRVDTFATAGDPFSDVTVPADLLGELADYRAATPAQNAAGLTHLFTGRELDDSTVGIAYSGALCSTRFSAGLTQGTFSPTIDSLIAAHEIGHNFGAPHDGASGSACESEPETFLMAPSINGSDQFSACSIQQMQDDVAGAACIVPLASADIEIVAVEQPARLLLGGQSSLNFEANNVGTQAVDNVAVDIAVPADTPLVTATATGGSCVTGAATVTCTMTTIAAGSGAGITLTVEPVAVGDFVFTASLAAPADDNPSNDEAAVTLGVDTAVDLAVSVPASTALIVNQSASVGVTVENRSLIAATDIGITVALGPGITLTSAAWPPGSCTVANGVATCDAASLASQSSSTVTLAITAGTEGNVSFSVTAAAAEIDPVVANNSTGGQITVGPAPTGAASDDGGGGSIGLAALLLLVLGAVHRVIGMASRDNDNRSYPPRDKSD